MRNFRFTPAILEKMNNIVKTFLEERNGTVRSCADKLKISKSSVYLYLTVKFKRFLEINSLAQIEIIRDCGCRYLTNENYRKVLAKLKYNLSVRAMHGGMATKRKWSLAKENYNITKENSYESNE